MTMDPMERFLYERDRVQLDGGRVRLRPGPEHPWVEIPLPRPVRQHMLLEATWVVAWEGPEADEHDVEAHTPQVSAFGLDGRHLWTLDAGDLPFFLRAGARCAGAAALSVIEGSLRLGSGPWYCMVDDPTAPRLGPLRHTGRPR